jgi:hypothetical protein
MTRSLRSRLVGVFLILAASLSISAGFKEMQILPTPVVLRFISGPPKVICQWDTPVWIIEYGWDRNIAFMLDPTNSVDPLYPLTGKPGTIKTTVSSGSVNKPSLNVGYGPDEVRIRYYPAEPETVTFTSVLTYKYVATAPTRNLVRTFEVKECKFVWLHLLAWDVEKIEDEIIEVSLEAETDLSIAEGDFNGEFQLDGKFSIRPQNKAVKCTTQEGEGNGKVRYKSQVRQLDSGGWLIRVTMAFDPFEGTKNAEINCKDKIDGRVISDKSFNTSDYQPANDLLQVVTLVWDGESKSSVYQSFGPNGVADYSLRAPEEPK